MSDEDKVVVAGVEEVMGVEELAKVVVLEGMAAAYKPRTDWVCLWCTEEVTTLEEEGLALELNEEEEEEEEEKEEEDEEDEEEDDEEEEKEEDEEKEEEVMIEEKAEEVDELDSDEVVGAAELDSEETKVVEGAAAMVETVWVPSPIVTVWRTVEYKVVVCSGFWA